MGTLLGQHPESTPEPRQLHCTAGYQHARDRLEPGRQRNPVQLGGQPIVVELHPHVTSLRPLLKPADAVIPGQAARETTVCVREGDPLDLLRVTETGIVRPWFAHRAQWSG